LGREWIYRPDIAWGFSETINEMDFLARLMQRNKGLPPVSGGHRRTFSTFI
jgi:hypothetical protein